jgi:glycosyltransferase involved in cell wall biosynthesis
VRVALCSTDEPFVGGGARHIVEWLELELLARGCEVDRIFLPQTSEPSTIYSQMMAFRWVDLSAADRVICFRPQSHMISHPHKIVWFIHHVRTYYDLWNSPYRGFHDGEANTALRRLIVEADTVALSEAKALFTNSHVVSKRLRDFNGLNSTVLYPPMLRPERFSCQGFSDEILYIGRIEHAKRAHLLVEALALTRSPVRLRLCGAAGGQDYSRQVRRLIDKHGLSERVAFENRWISEEEKAAALSLCRAVAYCPLDEDSYGYVTLEAAHSAKPIITTSDSGGVLEFVTDGTSGLVVAPNPAALAAAFDRLFENPNLASVLGEGAQQRVDELRISWDHVVECLLR